MEIKGTIINVGAPREGVARTTGTAWRIVEFVIQIEPSNSWEAEHPRYAAFSMSDGQNGRIAASDLRVGRRVVVHYDWTAQEANGRWWNRITAYSVRDIVTTPTNGAQATNAPSLGAAQAPTPQNATQAAGAAQGDGLPF